MENSVQIDMKDPGIVNTTRINDYYGNIQSPPDHDSPLALDEATNDDVARMVQWCCFDRMPLTWGELHVAHRFYVAFRSVVEANTPGRGLKDRQQVRDILLKMTESFCPSLRPALDLREADKYEELRAWLSANNVMAAWSRNHASVFIL